MPSFLESPYPAQLLAINPQDNDTFIYEVKRHPCSRSHGISQLSTPTDLASI